MKNYKMSRFQKFYHSREDALVDEYRKLENRDNSDFYTGGRMEAIEKAFGDMEMTEEELQRADKSSQEM